MLGACRKSKLGPRPTSSSCRTACGTSGSRLPPGYSATFAFYPRCAELVLYSLCLPADPLHCSWAPSACLAAGPLWGLCSRSSLCSRQDAGQHLPSGPLGYGQACLQQASAMPMPVLSEALSRSRGTASTAGLEHSQPLPPATCGAGCPWQLPTWPSADRPHCSAAASS